MNSTASFTVTPATAADAVLLQQVATFGGYPSAAALVEALIQQAIKAYQQHTYQPPGAGVTVT